MKSGAATTSKTEERRKKKTKTKTNVWSVLSNVLFHRFPYPILPSIKKKYIKLVTKKAIVN